MKCFLRTACLWFCILGVTALTAQPLQEQEDKVLHYARQLDSLKAVHAKLLAQADVLARQIDGLRGKELLSAGEHRQLEKLLRQSQVLENNLREFESREQDIWTSYRPALEILMVSYQKEIESLVGRMQKETDSKVREALLKEFNAALMKKRSCETRLYETSTSKPGGDVAAKPWDSQRDLEIKEALLQDWADALRKEIGVVDGRLRSLRKEEGVRRKAEELTLGMRVFNPNEELMGREVSVTEPNPETFKGVDLVNREPGAVGATPAREGLSVEASDQQTEAGGTASWRSLPDLQDQIRQLERLKTSLALRADTLQQRVRTCTILL
ncbi:MAG TPA: hypothetical protein VGB38_00555, partial [bacterium]